MAPLAICHTCGRIFQATNVFRIKGNATVRISDNSISCPYCRGVAETLDGVYEIFDGVLRSAQISIPAGRYDDVVAFLGKIKSEKDPENVRQAISEQAPELLPILARLPPFLKDHGYQIVAILLATLALFKSDSGDSYNIDDRDINIQQIIENYNQIVGEDTTSNDERVIIRRPNRKIQPYEKCWCRSGKTYRSCHGK